LAELEQAASPSEASAPAATTPTSLAIVVLTLRL
jgi:hypothetical protein